MPLLTVVEVEGCLAGNEEQLCVLGSALHTIVGIGQGVVHAVGNALVELLVLFIGDLSLGPGPEGGGLVHRLPVLMLDILRLLFIPLALLHLNWDANVIGVALENLLDRPVGEQVVMAFLVFALSFSLSKVKDDLGAPLGPFNGLDAEVARALRLPTNRIAGGQSRPAADDRDMVCHDEGRVEADAELTNECGITGGVSRQPAKELLGARAGDGAQVGDHLLSAHAHPIV